MPLCHLIVHALGAASCLAVIGITITMIAYALKGEFRHGWAQ